MEQGGLSTSFIIKQMQHFNKNVAVQITLELLFIYNSLLRKVHKKQG